jgi:hypothetical protein
MLLVRLSVLSRQQPEVAPVESFKNKIRYHKILDIKLLSH